MATIPLPRGRLALSRCYFDAYRLVSRSAAQLREPHAHRAIGTKQIVMHDRGEIDDKLAEIPTRINNGWDGSKAVAEPELPAR
jgi:hypothetical protein